MMSLSCSKERVAFSGTIKDFTGLDGCGLVIILDNGTVLEPAVLPTGVILIPDKKISFTYQNLANKYSICMAGPIVKILALRYL